MEALLDNMYSCVSHYNGCLCYEQVVPFQAHLQHPPTPGCFSLSLLPFLLDSNLLDAF